MFIKQKLYNLQSRFLYSIYPKIIDKYLQYANYFAIRKLKQAKAKTILVDSTIIHNAITHRTGWVSTGGQMWGEESIDSGRLSRIPIDKKFQQKDWGSIKYLPSIAYLEKNNILILCDSDELKDEQECHPSNRFRPTGWMDYSLFQDVKFKTIKDITYPVVINSWQNINHKNERKNRLEKNQKNNSLYQSLVEILGVKNSQDAWHITVANDNNCYCFLTMDYSLIRSIESQKGHIAIKSLKTKVMTPETFAKTFSLAQLHYKHLSYHDASFFVEPNLSISKSIKKR